MRTGPLIAALTSSLLACGTPPSTPDEPPPASSADAGEGVVLPGAIEVQVEASLFWTQPELVEDPALVSLATLMAIVAPDDHGGRLLDQWFRRFSTTAHSERALPAQWMDELAAQQGADPSGWSLSTLPFKVTGIHNRLDLARLGGAAADGHCGELRVSLTSVHPTVQPLHLLFLFEQPALPGDLAADGSVHCQETARRWAALSTLEGDARIAAARAMIAEGLTRERFLMMETVELTVSPWEWRQWVPTDDPTGALPFVLDNPPLHQTVDVEAVNPGGALRTQFLEFVTQNAAALDSRRLELPELFRPRSARVTQGVPRTPLDLSGLPPNITESHPALAQNIELMGCPACHTADAEFVQTLPDRTVSPFYEKELEARARFMERVARGEAALAPFGPLQATPILP